MPVLRIERRAPSFAFIALTYALAIAAAWRVFHLGGVSPIGALGLGFAAATGVTFVATLLTNNGSVFDAWWSVLPPVAALFFQSLALGEGATPRQVAVHAVVWFWAVRLTANWLRGWQGLAHEDWRYTRLYAKAPLPRWAVQLLAVQGFPTLVVTTGCIALYPALALGDDEMRALDWLALAVGLGAIALELAADEQMYAFSLTKKPGDLMDRGLWRWARHPNYLGEIGFWVSLWLFAWSARPDHWWTAIGPVAMTAMFVLASIPMLDERSRERRPGYAEYERKTPALLRWRPRRG
jgi:steroid 5-alpha reductase family enzyme